MARTALPTYIADLHIAVVVSATDEDDAELRLAAIAEAVVQKMEATTITRMAGKPRVGRAAVGEISEF